MTTIGLILMVFSLVLLIIASAGIVSVGRFQIGWGGLAFLVAALLFGGGHLLN